MTVIACPNCGANNKVDPSRAAGHQPVCGRCGTRLPESGSSSGISPEVLAHPVNITDANFAETLASAGDRPVLVDCWATWCPPCRALAPTIDQLAAESNGRYVITKLDTDANPRTASQFNISSIPALLIFKNGKLVDQLVGLQPKAAIAARLAKA